MHVFKALYMHVTNALFMAKISNPFNSKKHHFLIAHAIVTNKKASNVLKQQGYVFPLNLQGGNIIYNV